MARVANSHFRQDDIATVFHPSSGIPPKVEHFEDYGRDEDAIRDIAVDMDPTAKFGTRTEFKFAELILECGLNTPQTNRLLKLISEIRNGAPFGFRTNKDVQAAWDHATSFYTPVSTVLSLVRSASSSLYSVCRNEYN